MDLLRLMLGARCIAAGAQLPSAVIFAWLFYRERQRYLLWYALHFLVVGASYVAAALTAGQEAPILIPMIGSTFSGVVMLRGAADFFGVRLRRRT